MKTNKKKIKLENMTASAYFTIFANVFVEYNG